MRLRLIAALIAGLTVVAVAQSAPPAQTPPPAFTYRTNVGEVLVQCDVLDKHGRAVNGLPESDFTVYENGVPQEVDSFTQGDSPVSIGIVIDNSGSMMPRRAQVDQAALNFVRTSNPQDEVFIVKFNDEYDLLTGFTSSIPRMEKALGSVDPQSSTALYDALINSVDYMNQHAKWPKRVLLVVSDGLDDASSHDLQQTLKIIQSVNTPMIYTIGLLDDSWGKSAEKEAKKILIQLSDDTGGVAYFPKNLNQVNKTTVRIAHDVRQQYNLVYQSNQTTPGFRSIRVEVHDPHLKHLTAHTRRGYIAGN